MSKKEFKAESKRLLNLMINSIYTHKEIFLREIISNASDAVDKLCYLALTDQGVGMSREDFVISIKVDKENRLLTVSDNGIGMSSEELETNLGTIAQSGSLLFKNEMNASDKVEDIDIIGQFGVGFYSAFMVSDQVTVISRAYGSDKAYRWESSGVDGYSISECSKDEVGTEVIMKIKEDSEDEKYSQFLESYNLSSLIKKYSDYIRYPIKMDMEKSRLKENSDKEYESYFETETINSMVPIWHRTAAELSDEDYNSFYQDKFFDYEPPQKHIHIRAEGLVSYNALLYIPARTPFDYYTKEYEKGLQLYSSGVLIMEKCAELLPEHFRFVKGVVDSQDLSLNISREMLQHDRQLKTIANNIEKKIKSELQKMLENDREAYEVFYANFGRQLKYGIANDYGRHKDLLADLILFYSSQEEKLVSLAEYAARMPEEQTHIYYACGEDIKRIDQLPQTELLRDKGFEILYFTDEVDEFVTQILHKYEEKEFMSVNSNELDLENDEQKEESQKQTEENQDMLDAMQKLLESRVKKVKISKKLKSHPLCLSNEGMISLEMEKYFNQVQPDNHMQAERVLELNPSHMVFNALQNVYSADKDKFRQYTELLYQQALLIAGFPLDDPTEFTRMVCDLMI